ITKLLLWHTMNLLTWIAFLVLLCAEINSMPKEALPHLQKSELGIQSRFLRELPKYSSETLNIKEKTLDNDSIAVSQSKGKVFKLSTTAILGLIGLVFGIIVFAGYLRYKYNHRTSYNR
ncbi:hypothetical protein KR059_010799, partial [Drosophila kikkawai]